MKDNKLFSAMGNIDEEMIDEALNAPKKKKLPVFRITAAAAAFVFIALAATVLVNINKQPDMIAESNTSNVQTSDNTDKETIETKGENSESSDYIFTGHYSVVSDDTNENGTSQASSADPTESTPASQTSETTPHDIGDDEENSDMLGFIIKDGKTYMQVFNNTEYTLDEDIGRAGDFKGYYSDLEDNSRVYTVMEDENILVVKFEAGGSVTLMLREKGLMDRMGYYRFYGLRVDQSVMTALSSNDGKAYSVYVTRPDSEDMYDYVYNGNFPINWEEYYCNSGLVPGDEVYPGKSAGSENETEAIISLCEENDFLWLLDMHVLGNGIFWRDSFNGEIKNDWVLASSLSEKCGYFLFENTTDPAEYSGGLENWFRYEYGRPSLYIEMIPYSQAYFSDTYSGYNSYFEDAVNWNETKYTYLESMACM